MKVNKVRVNYRQYLHSDKILLAKTQSSVAAFCEQEKRLERLSTIATLVPYYNAIQTVTLDIHKLTSCRKNDIHDTTLSAQLTQFQRNVMFSFTNERVFSDKKVSI